jgi:hypothetical protein
MTFLVLGSFCEMMDRNKYMIAIGISAVLIPIVIWFAMPDLKNYGGLSGLDCSLYALLGVLFIKREWRIRNWNWVIIYTIFISLLPAKIIYEMVTALTLFVGNTKTNMVPVPLSHLVGGVVGIAAGASIWGVKRNIKGMLSVLRLQEINKQIEFKPSISESPGFSVPAFVHLDFSSFGLAYFQTSMLRDYKIVNRNFHNCKRRNVNP